MKNTLPSRKEIQRMEKELMMRRMRISAEQLETMLSRERFDDCKHCNIELVTKKEIESGYCKSCQIMYEEAGEKLA